MKHFYNSLLALAAFFLVNCSASFNAKHYMHLEAIPKDVTKKGYTLLILKHTEKDKGVRYPEDINKAVEKLISSYPYPAILVSKEELNSPKYSDVNKYRYFLQPSDITRTTRETKVYGPQRINTFDYEREQFFTDRKENRDYPLTGYKVRFFNYGVKAILGYLKEG